MADAAEPRDLGKAYSRASHRANLDYVDRPYYLHRDLFRDTFRRFAGEFECEAPEDWVDEFEISLRTALVEKMVLRDDCLSTLKALRRRGLETAIVSNIDDRAQDSPDGADAIVLVQRLDHLFVFLLLFARSTQHEQIDDDKDQDISGRD